MVSLLNKFKTNVNGVITVFDRIVFKGMLVPIAYAAGMQYFLSTNTILNKYFKEYAVKQPKPIVESTDEISKRLCGRETTYIFSSNERKETIAHNRQKETGIKERLIRGMVMC